MSATAECIDRVPGSQRVQRVLIVEDNALIACDAEAMVLQAGADHVELAMNVSQAFSSLAQQAPTFAFLDVNLGDETSFPVADKLTDLGIPFAFLTGYDFSEDFPLHHQHVPRITKPYDLNRLRRAMDV